MKWCSLLLIGFVTLVLRSNGQTTQYQFGRIDMSDGLSHHTVNGIIQDTTGFLWFATSAGLNRFDGYSLKIFKNIPGDTTSLHVDDITDIFEGPHNRLWLYTHSGNVVYNPDKENFTRNTNKLLQNLGIGPGVITSVRKGASGRFWFIHYNQGLFLYDASSQTTRNFVHNKDDSTTIASMQLSSVQEDSNENLWLVHQNGVVEKLDVKSAKITYRDRRLQNLYNAQLFDYDLMVDSDGDVWLYSDRNFGCFLLKTKTNVLQNFSHTTGVARLNSGIVKKIVQDNSGIVWVGTENGGVTLINKKDLSAQHIFTDPNDPKSLGENTIHSLFKDRDGIIWLGSYKNGVSYYHPDIFRFNSYKQNVTLNGNPSVNDINAFAEDQSGNIWIGTNGAGLFYYDRKRRTYKQYRHDPRNVNSLSNDVIVSLLMDHNHVLWIGTYYGGVNTFVNGKFTRYMHEAGNSRSLGDDNIWEIYEDRQHNIWLGTLKGGVDVYDRDKEEFFHYKSGELNSIHTPYVPAVMEDKDGNMWIGTGYGLEVLRKESGRFTHYLNTPADSTSISNNSVMVTFQDSRGLIWIGTQGGLNLYDPKNNNFRVFQEQDGLAHNSILTLLEDSNGSLWMSTPKGLSKMIVTQGNAAEYRFTFANFGESDGLLSGAFHENAALKLKTGELIFGGSDGFNIFHPDDIKTDSTSPRTVFTSLEIFNQPVKANEEVTGVVVLPNSITTAREITLSPDINFITIEFAALNFFHPEKTQYRYMLQGFNDQWLITSSNQRRVTFTNLDPGTYRFKVQSTNSDGVWSDNEAILKITVLPPFWKTNLAFGLYAILLLATLLTGRKIIVARERMKFKIQQERLSAQRMHELDMMKIKFFTNVSHEFRTPLSLILAPMEKLLKGSSNPEEKKQFQLIHRNARRLLNLVNQLLDFRRMEVQQLKLTTSEGDIVQFIRDLVNTFSDLSEKKNIELSFHTSVQSLETLFDQDKIEKIVFNLLSNAFKFTPEGGSVSVSLSVSEEVNEKALSISVADNGIGIAPDKHQKIFERFFQSEVPDSMVNQGSGIGLSITAEFVKLHGGTIDVISESGKGSTFIVKIPVQDIHELAHEQDLSSLYPKVEVEDDIDLLPGKGGPTVMLVEDNDDFRFYLKDNLKSEYIIIEAANGKQAWEKAVESLPDLIVSDVMMPEMNGVEFCKLLKGDPRTSHIPVILLTARSSEEQKIEGFESGANDYITKPFNFEILQSRIKNLLHLRELGHKHFQKHFDIRVSEIEVASMDEKLIQNAVKVVEENLTGKDFSVEEMSRMLGMSRVQLYKKLYSLTGKTPIEFIRFIRIQRAAQLLEKSQLTVSEVAYQVGFNNPKYFAKYFRDEYKMLPSAYASEKRVKTKS